MFRSLLVILLCICSLSAEDIRISKDSLWVYNSIFSSKADAVIFRNNSPAAIHLDSANIVVEEMDTVGLPQTAGQSMELAWSGNPASNPYFIWTMESAGSNEFVLKKRTFLPAESQPLSFTGNGDSNQIFKLSIGYCLLPECRPYYPRYIKGNMKFYFSNGQIIALRLYSDDLRTPIKTPPRRGLIETCMFKDSLDFSSINDTCQIKKNKSGGACPYNTCPVLTPDVRITATKIYASKGVLFLGRILDTNCLDTLKRVPKSGYLDSTAFANYEGGQAFAIRTSEMNYAVLYSLPVRSEMPFIQFKWIYQPDTSADFIKVTSVQTTRQEMNATLRNVKAISNRDNIMVSWTPVPGTLQFKLFDLKGRQVYDWECDGQQGAVAVTMKTVKTAHSMHMLQILWYNDAKAAENYILLPR